MDAHDSGLGGIETAEQAARLGADYRSRVATDRIDVVGPLLKGRR